MPKKKNWLERIKHFFGADTKSKQNKKEKRKRWLFGRLKLKSSSALPAPSTRIGKSASGVDEEHSKYVMAVAVATTVAAEAVIAAAQAAAQVGQLTPAPLSHPNRREVAAIKIQSAFRGYLARKALRALKGLVILQALIRGQTVRRQTTMTLRSLQTLMNIQSAARASRVRIAADRQAFEDKAIINAKIKKSGDMRTALQHYSGRDWDSSTLSKEDINSMLKSRLTAALKRERVIDYASYHQERRNLWRPTTAQDTDLPNQRWSWLDRWVEASPLEKDIYVNAPVPSPEHNVDDYQLHSPDSLVLLNTTHNPNDENRLRFLARRSFNRARETESITSSPCLPSYMASTASTKARFRSMSTPKQRMSVTDFTVTEACCDHVSSFPNSLLSPLPSVASETGNHLMSHRKSPSQWSQTGPVRSRRSSKYLSFDSECSLLNWDRHNVVR